jgi:hypothetical protein
MRHLGRPSSITLEQADATPPAFGIVKLAASWVA